MSVSPIAIPRRGELSRGLIEIEGCVLFAEVPSFPGFFACNQGHIYSIRRADTSIGIKRLAGTIDSDGYRFAVYWRNRARLQPKFHQLVAEAFLGARPTDRHQVRHLNGVRLDNRPENLAWGTAVEQAADRVLHGTSIRGSADGNAKLTESLVQEIREFHAAGIRLVDLGRAYDVHLETIRRIVKRERWNHV